MVTIPPDDPLAVLKSWPGTHAKVAVTDIDGVLRGKYLHKDKLLKAAETGLGFCNVVFGWDVADECYDNADYTGWHTGYPDALARLDLATTRSIPWEDGRPFVLGEFVDETGSALPVCPRQVLRGVVERAGRLELVPRFALEFEWFNFAETSATAEEKDYRDLTPIDVGMFGYSVIRQSTNADFFEALLSGLDAYGVPIEGLHTETGPGVLEAAIVHTDALEAADRAVLFKTACKEIGARQGILPTFMARVNSSHPGCGGHHHQSLWSRDRTRNLFASTDPDSPMSTLFENYLAGQLAYLGDLLPMVAPTVNSYKRLVEGFWAPTRPTWGFDNRTVACRVITAGTAGTRLESRVPGSDVNPYLSVAACLGAGLRGIEEELTLDRPPTTGSGYEDRAAPRYPRTLQQATDRFAESSTARELFGDAFVDHLAASREWEWRQSLSAVTDWELMRYLEII